MSNGPGSLALTAQALGIAAFLISLTGYLSPCDRRMKVAMTLGTGLFALQFVLFGSWLVAVSLIFNTARTWLSIYRRGLRLFVAVAIVQACIGILLARHPYDAFPVAGSIVGSFGLLCLSGPRLRAAMLITTMFWFFNNLIWGSIGGLMLDALNAAAHLRAIYLLRAAKENGPEEEGRTHTD